MNLVLVGMLADNQANAASHEAMFTVGYFLCGFAVLVSIGILVMTIKLKNINEINYKNKKNTHL